MTSVASLALAAASDNTWRPAHLLAAGVIAILAIGVVAVFVAVVISILRSRLSTGMKIIWVLFVLWLPVLAWFAWVLLGKPDAQRRNGTPVVL
jgi:hypothetical protein